MSLDGTYINTRWASLSGRWEMKSLYWRDWNKQENGDHWKFNKRIVHLITLTCSTIVHVHVGLHMCTIRFSFSMYSTCTCTCMTIMYTQISNCGKMYSTLIACMQKCNHTKCNHTNVCMHKDMQEYAIHVPSPLYHLTMSRAERK